MKIKCVTLFDITKTNINNRRRDLDTLPNSIDRKPRSQQSNFETLLQIIALRSQPENISDPQREVSNKYNNLWGSNYKFKKEKIPTWQFSFTVSQASVFATTDDKLGLLIKDCEGVPFITGLEEFKELQMQLSMEPISKNIHFEIENDQSDF